MSARADVLNGAVILHNGLRGGRCSLTLVPAGEKVGKGVIAEPRFLGSCDTASQCRSVSVHRSTCVRVESVSPWKCILNRCAHASV